MIAAGQLLTSRSRATKIPPIVAPNIGINESTNEMAIDGRARFAGTSWMKIQMIKTASPEASAPMPDTVICPVT